MQVVKANPVVLTDEQIRQYEEDGFLVVPDVFDESVCDEIKAEALQHAEEDYRVYLNIHRDVPFFMDIARDPVLVGIVKQVQKSRICATNDQFLFKRPGTVYAKQSWSPHQDNAYVKAPHGHYMQLHVFVDAADETNGCVYYYRGSHVEDLLPYEYVNSTHEKPDADGITRPGWKITPPSQYTKVNAAASKGSICLQHGNAIHGSYPNMTEDRDRCQYTIAYLNEGSPFDEGYSSKKIPVDVE